MAWDQVHWYLHLNIISTAMKVLVLTINVHSYINYFKKTNKILNKTNVYNGHFRTLESVLSTEISLM